MVVFEYEWDHAKAAANLEKRGGFFEEAAAVFDDPLARMIPDPDHSADEDRFLMLGVSSEGHLFVVSFTCRGTRLRIISARSATPAERRDYERHDSR